MMSNFFSRLSYSIGNEDWSAESQALQIKPTDRVLCITASGDRPLHAVLDGSQDVVAIDANPTQNYLFELKREAIRSLDYDEYLNFLGINPGNNRLKQLNKLIEKMEATSADYWKKNKKMIEKGVIYQGFFEKWIKAASYLLRFLRGKKIKGLFAVKTLDEQRRFLKAEWNTYWWRKLFDIVLTPWLMKLTINDPALYSFVDPNKKLSDFVYDRLDNCLNNHLAKENYLVSYIFRGYITEESWPPYLTKEGCKKIKTGLDRIKWQTIDLLSYLKSSPDNSIDCFSLSDVASYISQSDFEVLMGEVYRTARMGARFSIRQVFSNHQIPCHLKTFFQRNTELESKLNTADRCFIYRFMAGTVKK